MGRRGKGPLASNELRSYVGSPGRSNDEQLEDPGETMAKAEEPQGLRLLGKIKREKSWCRPPGKAHPKQG